MTQPTITEEMLALAVREGVADALAALLPERLLDPADILAAIANGTKQAVGIYLNPNPAFIRTEDILNFATDAIAKGVFDSFPTHREVSEAITKGVIEAMPWSESVLDAIYNATRKAMPND